ncbi:autotransporter assembly complex protein TamA [Cereibacter sphaeroides]|nr:autotransporter assembly complex protein TamA [Cereibacter sphaeroides]
MRWWRALALSLSLPLVALAPSAKALESIELNAPGASDSLIETLRASSLLLTAQTTDRTAPLDLMAAARAEYGRLITLLYEEAYYAPVIHVYVDGREAADISPLQNPGQIDNIRIDVTLGPQFTFSDVSIEPLAPGTVLPEGFAVGQPARSTTVRAALNAGLDAWRARGHALAEAADQQIVANHRDHTLRVRLRLAPGEALRIGAITPAGQQRTRPQRIVDIAGLEPGVLHDPEAITDAETRLRETGTFASVVLETAETANPDDTVDVTIRVDEAPLRRLGFGAEIDSESGGRLSGFWLHRNLLGGAERLRLEAAVDGIGARVGGLGFTLDARYTRPATLDPDTDLELGLSATRLNEDDYLADAYEASGLLRRQFSDALEGEAGLSLRFENASYDNNSGVTIYRDFGTFGIPVSLTHDTRDEALDATSGHYVSLDAMPYLGFADAESGIRLQFDARLYNDLGTEGRVTLAARAQLGAVVGPAINNTPRGFLFYSGGGGSVRGLPYQSLGVTVSNVNSGGRGFAALSTEARVRINDSFSVVAFADAGAVSSGAFSGQNDWQAGGGVGVRYATPIGPLRLDLAVPIRRNAGVTGSNLQIYLGIGQAF